MVGIGSGSPKGNPAQRFGIVRFVGATAKKLYRLKSDEWYWVL